MIVSESILDICSSVKIVPLFVSLTNWLNKETAMVGYILLCFQIVCNFLPSISDTTDFRVGNSNIKSLFGRNFLSSFLYSFFVLSTDSTISLMFGFSFWVIRLNNFCRCQYIPQKALRRIICASSNLLALFQLTLNSSPIFAIRLPR